MKKISLTVLAVPLVLLYSCGASETAELPSETAVYTPAAAAQPAVTEITEPPQTTAETTQTTAAVTETTTETTVQTISADAEPEPLAAPETEAPAVQEAEEPAAEAEPTAFSVFVGVLIDEDCSDVASPPKHDLPCMLMESCRASGYGLDILQDDGTWQFYMFDENGQTLSYDYLKQTDRMDGLFVSVTGTLEDGIIHVYQLEEI